MSIFYYNPHSNWLATDVSHDATHTSYTRIANDPNLCENDCALGSDTFSELYTPLPDTFTVYSGDAGDISGEYNFTEEILSHVVDTWRASESALQSGAVAEVRSPTHPLSEIHPGWGGTYQIVIVGNNGAVSIITDAYCNDGCTDVLFYLN